MSFSVNWYTLLEEAEDLPPDAVLVTPLSHTPFRISETQEHRIIIDYVEKDETRPLQREQFETLFRRVHDEYPVALSKLIRWTEQSGQNLARR